MIRVGLLTERLKGRVKWVTELFALTIAALFIGYFAWFAVDLVITSWRINDMSTGVLVVPLWIPQTGYATGLFILFIAIVDELARVVRGLKPTYEKEPPKTADEVIERAVSSGV
jgi:TRAP-type C4-dicarboxylate transport system permease small subunit